MIKVNLLRDQGARERKPIAAVKPEVSRSGLLIVAIFAVLVLGIGSYWFYLSGEINSLTAQRDTLRVESEKLRALRKEVERFDKLKQLHQSRIEVIERLRESQTGPVLMMNHLIHSVPGELWLTSLEQKGDRIKIAGNAFRGEAIPDFMTSLSRSGFFESVDLEILEDQKDTARFSLMCVTKQKARTE